MITEKQLYNLILTNKKLNLATALNKNYYNPHSNSTTSSSVLVIVHYTEGFPSVILTKRSGIMKRHGGEISFPGGKFSSEDKSIIETAIRETFEEIGLMIKKEKILGCLNPTNTYTTNIMIFPFIAIEEKLVNPLIPNSEVEEILSIPLQTLKESLTIDEEHSQNQLIMYKFSFENVNVWGATARILKNFLDILPI